VGRRPFSDQQTDAGPKRGWLRIFAIALGGIGFVLGAIYVAVIVAFPPGRLAVLLADQVKAATGREFRIDGGLSIRVLPSIAIQVRDVVLGNAAWGSRVDMATVRRAAIDVSPGALLKGELRILRIDVEGVDALLEVDGAGRYNWQFTPPTSPAADTKPAPADGQAPWFDLKRVVASDVLVAYRDGSKSPPQTLTIESLDLRSNDREIEIALALAIGKQRWKVEGQVGRGAILLEGKEDWPFDLRLTGDGATVSAKGAIGTGERAGTAVADVSAELASAAALAPLGATALGARALGGTGPIAQRIVAGGTSGAGISAADALAPSLGDADIVVFLQRPELAWDAGKVIAGLRGEGVGAPDADALIAALQQRVRAGDHVVFMSNGGFDGAPRRFLAALPR